MPIDLMLEGRPCLVVGGGNVATRKIGHLLEAGAQVRVVSAALSDEGTKWAAGGRIEHIARNFRNGDVRGQLLVFAATDDAEVNRAVVACCRKRRILCNAADGNWVNADFLTPAICRKGGLTVTVSTGGRSCRLARIVKDRIAPILDAIMAKNDAPEGRSVRGRDGARPSSGGTTSVSSVASRQTSTRMTRS
jgi:siroheme synthase-like protein